MSNESVVDHKRSVVTSDQFRAGRSRKPLRDAASSVFKKSSVTDSRSLVADAGEAGDVFEEFPGDIEAIPGFAGEFGSDMAEFRHALPSLRHDKICCRDGISSLFD